MKLNSTKRMLNNEINFNSPIHSLIDDEILLKNGEILLFSKNVRFFEPRAVRRSSHSGASFGGWRGRLYAGGTVSTSNDVITYIDDGVLYLTNKRLIFKGNKKSSNVKFGKIMNLSYNGDKLIVNRENKQKIKAYWLINDNFTYNSIQFSIKEEEIIRKIIQNNI